MPESLQFSMSEAIVALFSPVLKYIDRLDQCIVVAFADATNGRLDAALSYLNGGLC